MIVDFEKIKTAAEDIKLTDTEKENIILLCEESKKTKKKSRFVPVAAAAAVAVFAFVIFSPGFLLKASEADKNFAPQENAVANDYELLADSIDDAAGVIVQSSTTENPDFKNDEGGGVITVQKYRHKFYSVPGTFIDYVDRDDYYEWLLTIDHTSTAEVMVIKQFVQHFNITREQFDRANLEYAKRIQNKLGGSPCINPKDYANQEDDEVYNADIIFTFDDDLIREYYLSPDYPYLYDIEFEEAVARGEYTSQTEEWIDIEEMEAEISAKYGEAEIVTQ